MRKTLRILAALAMPLTLPAADKVSLYLQPDTQSNILAELEEDDQRLAHAEPVVDQSKRVEGWFWIDYRNTFTGFVENKEIGKDLEVKPGALVHLEASVLSPILTTIRKGDQVELIAAEDWGEIQFTKAVPVYFKKPSETPSLTILEVETTSLAEVTTPAEETTLPAETPLPVEGAGSAEKTPSTPVPFSSSSIPSAVSQAPSSKDLPRYFEGTLKMTSALFGKTPKHLLQIVDSEGKRLAFVDTSALLISSSIENYLGQKVILYGEATTVTGSRHIVVNARTLRLK